MYGKYRQPNILKYFTFIPVSFFFLVYNVQSVLGRKLVIKQKKNDFVMNIIRYNLILVKSFRTNEMNLVGHFAGNCLK